MCHQHNQVLLYNQNLKGTEVYLESCTEHKDRLSTLVYRCRWWCEHEEYKQSQVHIGFPTDMDSCMNPGNKHILMDILHWWCSLLLDRRQWVHQCNQVDMYTSHCD